VVTCHQNRKILDNAIVHETLQRLTSLFLEQLMKAKKNKLMKD